MEFEWDERKRRETLRKHGVDLLEAALIFEGPVLSRPDDRKDYGEIREVSLGMVDGEIFVVVHTERHGKTRLITAWKGGKREKAAYQKRIAGRDPQNEGLR